MHTIAHTSHLHFLKDKYVIIQFQKSLTCPRLPQIKISGSENIFPAKVSTPWVLRNGSKMSFVKLPVIKVYIMINVHCNCINIINTFKIHIILINFLMMALFFNLSITKSGCWSNSRYESKKSTAR